MGRAFFIAGRCIAGVFIFNPGSGLNVTRDMATDERALVGANTRSADQLFDLPVRVLGRP